MKQVQGIQTKNAKNNMIAQQNYTSEYKQNLRINRTLYANNAGTMEFLKYEL